MHPRYRHWGYRMGKGLCPPEAATSHARGFQRRVPPKMRTLRLSARWPTLESDRQQIQIQLEMPTLADLAEHS